MDDLLSQITSLIGRERKQVLAWVASLPDSGISPLTATSPNSHL